MRDLLFPLWPYGSVSRDRRSSRTGRFAGVLGLRSRVSLHKVADRGAGPARQTPSPLPGHDSLIVPATSVSSRTLASERSRRHKSITSLRWASSGITAWRTRGICPGLRLRSAGRTWCRAGPSSRPRRSARPVLQGQHDRALELDPGQVALERHLVDPLHELLRLGAPHRLVGVLVHDRPSVERPSPPGRIRCCTCPPARSGGRGTACISIRNAGR